MKHQAVATTKAPGAIGPFVQAIKANSMVYVSGQLPIDPATGEFPSTDIKVLTKQSMENLSAVLVEAGSDLENIVKTTIFMTDLNHFADMNQVYASFFPNGAPARSCVQVGALPKGALVEIEAVATLN